MSAHVSTAARTRAFFESLFKQGSLVSMYDQYIYDNIRRPSDPSGSFYTRTLAKQGPKAAEAELTEWTTRTRMSDYASLIEPVARGMFALASADRGVESEYVKLVEITRNSPFPHHHLINQGKMAVLINREAYDYGCTNSRNSEIFDPYGRIGIKAIVLSIDHNNPDATQLGVVLPIREYDNYDPAIRKSGFTVAMIGLTGRIDATTVLPPQADPDFLVKILGLTDVQLPRGRQISGGHFDDVVGFPGATDYLVDTLPKLEQYFTDLAEKLESKYKH